MIRGNVLRSQGRAQKRQDDNNARESRGHNQQGRREGQHGQQQQDLQGVRHLLMALGGNAAGDGRQGQTRLSVYGQSGGKQEQKNKQSYSAQCHEGSSVWGRASSERRRALAAAMAESGWVSARAR